MMIRKKGSSKNIKSFNLLIRKIGKKQKEALKTFYDIYGQLIYITAQTTVKCSFKADEVVNDVLLKIWTLSPSLKKIDNPEGWLYSITKNCAKDKIKYEKNCQALFDIATSDTQIEQILDKDEFYNDIKTLNELEQQILIFKFLFDLTFEQIAFKLQKSIAYISTTYYRSLDKIKDKFE